MTEQIVWTPETWKALTPEKRTSELKKAITIGVKVLGKRSASELVPLLAHQVGVCKAPNKLSLAEAVGVDRGMMSRCLNGDRRCPGVREKLDAALGLVESKPGGMTNVLALVEALP